MSEEKNVANAKNVVVNDVKEEQSLVLEFHKPYVFEGKTYD